MLLTQALSSQLKGGILRGKLVSIPRVSVVSTNRSFVTHGYVGIASPIYLGAAARDPGRRNGRKERLALFLVPVPPGSVDRMPGAYGYIVSTAESHS